MPTLCPKCGKNHQFQHTAQKCFQEAMISFDMRVVSGDKLSPDERKQKVVMKKYYFGLPMHKKYLSLNGRGRHEA